ncbi:MAG: hypothetical protein JWN44_5511 [Myxococcales bacterium]|nr:hypothetical protein [Myxococcales bacterium]
MVALPRTLHVDPADVTDEVIAWGNTVSGALLDGDCGHFRVEGIDGLIGYRAGLRCAVVMGDPVCAEADKPRLAAAFRDWCRARGWTTVYVVTSEGFSRWAIDAGMAAVSFGEELVLDPMHDAQAGSTGRELRKKINRAKKAGLAVSEYVPSTLADHDLERAMEAVATSWLDARRGPQIYIARLDLFGQPRGKRWFYARHGERIVGALSMNRLDAREGWLIDHLVCTPDAPQGITEILVVEALAALRKDGCRYATFGAAPGRSLGDVAGFGALSEKLARAVFSGAGRVFHLDARTRYRQKFQAVRSDPAYILFDPPSVGVREVVGIMRAFNVSLRG